MLSGLLPVLVLAASLQAAPSADEGCLKGCHGFTKIQAKSGHTLYVDAERMHKGPHGRLSCAKCHPGAGDYPHKNGVTKVACVTCHEKTAAGMQKSAHSLKGGPGACSGCHGTAHVVEAHPGSAQRDCAHCHAAEVRAFEGSAHGVAARKGDPDGPTCKSCHGSLHQIRSSKDPESTVAKAKLPDMCGRCHGNPGFLARHKIPFARPVDAYRLSVHGRSLARGNLKAASCTDCHSAHDILPGTDPRSKINHWNVPKTCGGCHTQVAATFMESVHGKGVREEMPGAPVCTDCHGEHKILPPSDAASPVSQSRISAATCERCHADERVTSRYNLPTDKVPAYEDSYHGLAVRSGSQTVANCASCHGVHNILPSSDPRSTIYPSNLPRTCGSCHPGAGESFAIGSVHVRSAATEHPAVKWIRWAYLLLLIPGTLGFMALHHLVDFLSKLIRPRHHEPVGGTVPRMNLHFRIEHWMVMVSFPTLVITGFALKFPQAWWSAPLLKFETHFALRGTVHRVAAVIMTLSVVYHLLHLMFVRQDRKFLKYVLPNLKDATDAVGMLRYNLGFSGKRPAFGPLNYAEKMEYLAFMWGSVVMVGSGCLLWFNNLSLRFLPKWSTDVATAVHYYEAILATAAIAIWHSYIVVFDPDVYPMDFAWLTGRASAGHMKHARPVYYRALRIHEHTRAAAAGRKNPPSAGGTHK